MMRKVKLKNLRVKIFIEKKPESKLTEKPSSLEVISLTNNRLYFSKAIKPDYFSELSKITVFLKIAREWKPYILSDFWAAEDEKEFGKVDCLVFNFSNTKDGDSFKYDLEGARC